MAKDRVDHHDHDKIVELCRVHGRFEADVIVAKLRANGITASTNYADAGGYLPRSGLLGGSQILVFDCDLERATELTNAPEPDDAPSN